VFLVIGTAGTSGTNCSVAGFNYDPYGHITRTQFGSVPENLIRYAYAASNPANYIDPTGQSILGDFFNSLDVIYALGAPNLNEGIKVVAGVAAGVATDTICNFALGVADVPTAGLATVLGETGCTVSAASADSEVASSIQ
jgi:hypothetical protein